MDQPTAFRFPPRDGQPLPTLPAERVNGTRPVSSLSTTTTISHKSSKTTESELQEYVSSPQSSPTRRAKASLFVDPSATPVNKVSGFALPQSPSLPEIHALRSHVRTNSDVQGLVKRFEHLDVRDRDAESVERSKRHEAELRRAQIAREEAESDVKRLREELRRLKREGEESRERERKVAKRLEVVMEDFGTAKDSHDSQHGVLEKELRKMRKEAFKSSSAVLKLQEELKSTRNTLRVTQAGFDLEKQKVQRKEQERFEMEYQLIPLQEQVDKLKQKLRIAEEEREVLKTNLHEGEVARIAAEGMIALPVSQDMDLDLLSSPRKQRSPQENRIMNEIDEDKENMGVLPKKTLESRRLAEELDKEKMRRENTEELVDFLRMECMFRCCGCRMASRLGHEFALELDAELAAGVDKIRAGMEGIVALPGSLSEEDDMDVESGLIVKTEEVGGEVEEIHEEATAPEKLMPDDHLDRSITLQAESPIQSRSPDDQLHEEEEKAIQQPSIQPELKASPATSTTEATITTVPIQPQTPPHPPQHLQTTPFRLNQPSIRTVTTTTTVPTQFTPLTKPLHPPVFEEAEDAENIPPPSATTSSADGGAERTFDRAAALAAIEWRRGRAKSIANGQATPRKQMVEGVGVGGRRDISAPALGGAQKVKGAAGVGGSVRGRR